jgi:cell division protein ZipA
MHDLRLILLLVGAALVGVIYLWELRRRRSRREKQLERDAFRDDLYDESPDEFPGPRVRRRVGQAPVLGALDGLERRAPEQMAAREPPPEPDEPGPDEPGPGAPGPGAPELRGPEQRGPERGGPERGGAEPDGATGAAGPAGAEIGARAVIDVDDIDAIAAAPEQALVTEQASAQTHPASRVSGAVRLPDVSGAGAETPPVELDNAAAGGGAGVPAPPSSSAARERLLPDALAGLEGLHASRDGPRQLDLDGLGLASRGEGGSGRQREPRVEAADSGADAELVIALTVMARVGQQLSGPAIRSALELVGLTHGEMAIYHRHAVGQPPGAPPVFSVANVRNPGTFDPRAFEALRTPGLAFFMRVPGPIDAGSAFQQMLDAGRRVAERVNGILCDETRSTLTTQSINHIRERIAEHARRRLITQRG